MLSNDEEAVPLSNTTVASTLRGRPQQGIFTTLAFLGRHPVATTFVAAFLIRLLVITIMANFIGYLVWDDSTYHEMARAMAAGETAPWHPFIHWLYWNNATMLVPITSLYELFGPDEIIGQIFVAFFGAGTAALVTRLLVEFENRRWSLTGGLVAALLPSQVLWSSLILKDALVWLLLSSLALVALIAARRDGRTLLLLALIAATLLILLAYLRDHTLIVACWALVLAALLSARPFRIRRIVGAAAMAVSIPWAVGLGPAGATFVASGAESLPDIRLENARGANTAVVETFGMDPAYERSNPLSGGIGKEQHGGTGKEQPGGTGKEQPGGTGKEQHGGIGKEQHGGIGKEQPAGHELGGLEIAGWERTTKPSIEEPAETAPETGVLAPNLRHLPTGLSVILLEPFPGRDTQSTAMRLAQLEMFIWYPLLALALVGLWPAFKRIGRLAFGLFASGGVLFVYALSEGNVGTAFRHRGELVWMIIVLAVLGARWAWGKIQSSQEGSAS